MKGFYVVVTLGIDARDEADAREQLRRIFDDKRADNTWEVEARVLGETEPSWSDE